MKEYNLTKEANALLCILYAAYKERYKSMPNSEARMCGDLEEVQKYVESEFVIEDTLDYCWELNENGLLDVVEGDDAFMASQLTIEAVAFMQNRTKNEIKKIVGKCFPVLPATIKLFL